MEHILFVGFSRSVAMSVPSLIFISLDNVVGIVLGVLLLYRTVNGSMAGVFILNLYFGWAYCITAVYVKANFPIQYFGRLMGIMRISMGLSSLLIIGLAEVTNRWPNSGFNSIFILFIVLMVVGVIFPIHGFIIANKKRS